jgi:hypothetical protein
MLTSGMVPALFPDDEKEAIIGQVHVKYFGVRSCMRNRLIIILIQLHVKKVFPEDFQTAQVFACYSGFRIDRAVQHK